MAATLPIWPTERDSAKTGGLWAGVVVYCFLGVYLAEVSLITLP